MRISYRLLSFVAWRSVNEPQRPIGMTCLHLQDVRLIHISASISSLRFYSFESVGAYAIANADFIDHRS
jgi:hypothetical protein